MQAHEPPNALVDRCIAPLGRGLGRGAAEAIGKSFNHLSLRHFAQRPHQWLSLALPAALRSMRHLALRWLMSRSLRYPLR